MTRNRIIYPVTNSGFSSIELESASVRIAVLVPCFNEELTVAQTVCGFRRALPNATIVVCDNNSTDGTAWHAREAGAEVLTEDRQGKGNAVRRLFADVEADIYLLVDGDATYDPDAAPAMIEKMFNANLDFLNGARVTEIAAAYRPGHRLGNYVLSNLVQTIFGRQFDDMLSGYKVFSRRFVKSFPATSSGFEIETELTVHALELRVACTEVQTRYVDRPRGSVSKLRTYRDGARILRLIVNLVRHERPLMFFGLGGAFLMLMAVLLAIPLITTYLETGVVPRLPTAVLVVGLTVTGVLSLFCGMILDTVSGTRREIKRLVYLSIPALRDIKAQSASRGEA
jgi:glycosyltransferase involved in cell wall biosynthesis